MSDHQSSPASDTPSSDASLAAAAPAAAAAAGENGGSRRSFIKRSSAVLATGAVGTGLALSRSAHAFGSDTIRVGLIGAGGRGVGAARQALNTEGSTSLVAIGDVFDHRLQGAMRNLESAHPGKIEIGPDQRFVGLDAFQGVLASDCDLVILATPPGFRPQHFEAAIEAGKHVFMEKPVAVDAPGVRRVLAANEKAKEKGLAVAVGLQRHHESGYRETIKFLQEGAIGDIILTRVYWNMGPLWVRNRRPDQSELSYQLDNWYYFNWLCGDHIVEQHIHNLDVSNWLMGAYPAEAQGQGGRQVRTAKEYGQIYDHHFVEYTYPNGTKMLSQCRQIEGCWGSVSEHAHGTKGWCDISGGKIYDAKGEVVWRAPANEDGWQQEHHHLFADLRKGDIPNEGEYGALSTMTAIMGRMATYSGKRLTWEECLASDVSLADIDSLNRFDDPAPVQPDAEGYYPVPQPGSYDPLRQA
jgi:myo-inositol 2-dehydrogenase/D-chiro-inositol 1-dehydrogenase